MRKIDGGRGEAGVSAAVIRGSSFQRAGLASNGIGFPVEAARWRKIDGFTVEVDTEKKTVQSDLESETSRTCGDARLNMGIKLYDRIKGP